MATTTNYGWTTPDDTDLVKDGAAAIRTLGSSVDTTTKDLNPETTLGDISFRSATSNVNTRLPIGSSGQHLTVVAGVPAWATPSDQTPLTTKGDLFTFSTVDARLGVGTNNYVLTADSAEATGLKWAAPAGGGKVLQVVSASTTTSTTIATTTFTDTTLTASITPTAATSTILVIANQVVYTNRSGVKIFAKGRIMRDSTSVYELGYIGGFGVPNATGTIELFASWTPVYLDSPATTSSITYKTQVARTEASGNTDVQFGSNPSTITLLEIGA